VAHQVECEDVGHGSVSRNSYTHLLSQLRNCPTQAGQLQTISAMEIVIHRSSHFGWEGIWNWLWPINSAGASIYQGLAETMAQKMYREAPGLLAAPPYVGPTMFTMIRHDE
jgi:hypothetical protein